MSLALSVGEAPGTAERSMLQHPRGGGWRAAPSWDEVIIEHAGQEYHLRHTRAGKLILTQ